MKVKCRLKISRPNSSSGGEYITLDLTDVVAGVQFVSVDMPLADFMRCLTASPQECMADVEELDKVGTKREHKRELVYVQRCKDADQQARAVNIAVSRHEHDGWKGHLLDAFNHHNRQPVHDYEEGVARFDAYMVSFERHVARSSDDEPSVAAGPEDRSEDA